MRLKAFAFAILLSVCGRAQQAPPTAVPAPKVTAPQITAEQRAKFWRAQAEAISAQARADQAKTAFDAAVEALKKACGEQQLIVGQDGEPTCQPKSEAAKAPAK